MYSYLIILLPPKNVIKTIDKYRLKYAKYTNYIIPPHITVYPPFLLKGITEKQLIAKLNKDFINTKCSEISLKSIDYFKGRNNVAYVKPDIKSSKYIANLLVKTVKSLDGYTNKLYGGYNIIPEKFNLHMTIAERIPNASLPRVKKELTSFNHEFSFRIESFYIFKKAIDTKSWSMLQKISFN